MSPDFAYGAHRTRDEECIDQKRGQLARRRSAFENVLPADEDHHRDRGHDEHHDDRNEPGALTNSRNRDSEGDRDPFKETLEVTLLSAERLHEFDGAQRLADVAADIRQRVLRRARKPPYPTTEHQHREHDERYTNEHHDGQFRVGQKEQDHAAEEREDVAQRDRGGRADDRLQQSGVGRDSRLNLGRRVFFEEAGMQPDQPVVDGHPDIGADPLAHPGNEIETGERPDREHDTERDEDEDTRRQEFRAVGRETFIDEKPKAERDGQGNRRRDDERHERIADLAGIGHDELERGNQALETLTRWSLGFDLHARDPRKSYA